MEILTVAKDLAGLLGPVAWKKLIEYKGKPHGSKVKEGAFKDCTIELIEDKAFIAVAPEKGFYSHYIV